MSNRASIIHRQSSIANRQSAIGNRQSSIGNRQSSIGNRQSSIVNRQSPIGNRQSSIVNRQSAIVNRQSPIGNRQSALARGFTLIEVMLVVVIIGITAGITIPRLTGTFKSAQRSDAVRSTVRIARYARSLSILQEEVCTLRFETNRLVLVSGTNSASPEATRKLPEDIQITSFETLTGEDRTSRERREVRFYPTGMNDGFTLTLSAGESRRTTILCNPVSGKITVREESR